MKRIPPHKQKLMKCQYTKPDSKRCNANSLVETKYCFSHNPKTQGEKKKAVLKGGLAPKPRKNAKRLEPLPLKSVEDIQSLIEDTINRVRTEPMTHQKANCVGYLANIALKALEINEPEKVEERTIDKILTPEQEKILDKALNYAAEKTEQARDETIRR